MKGFSSFFGLAADWRSVMRGLVREPGYAITAWVMLGLAVAANAAVFPLFKASLDSGSRTARPE